MSNTPEILAGKVLISGAIILQTGLHIGGETEAIEHGRMGNIILRNRLTNQPYIPGSSLRGKLRSLLELRLGKAQNWSIRRDDDGKRVVSIHVCIDRDDEPATPNQPPAFFKDEEFNETGEICPVCWIFGLPAEASGGHSTRLYVDDCLLEEELSTEETEMKWEAVIDRITSAAVPRRVERVPKDCRFSLSLSYEIYQNGADSPHPNDIDRLFDLFTLLVELEDYYIGGSGSRGYGSIAFADLAVRWKPRGWYEQEKLPEPQLINGENKTPIEIVKNFKTEIRTKLMEVEA